LGGGGRRHEAIGNSKREEEERGRSWGVGGPVAGEEKRG